jgi:DNA-directed RNA polymerase subunit RPC12/RpoP
MESNDSLRMVQKVFKCPLCLKGFKKLVHVNEQYSRCPECGHEHCSEMINSEFNRESVDSQYRLPFCNLPEEVRKQYHTVTDIHDKSPNNFYLDARRNVPNNNANNNLNNNNNINNNFRNNNNTNQNNNNAQNSNNAQNNPPRNYNLFFIPFNVSPFSGSVNRSPYNFAVFEGPIGEGNFANPSSNFFLDNFASNFISNFINPNTRIVFINNMQNQHQGNPPASNTAIEKLKHFKMEKKYCKKDDKDPKKLEYPECSICLTEVNEGEDTILLPCGHMFHDACVTKWLKIHNTCPLCRFELPTDDADYERERNMRNQRREENIRNNPNIHQVDLNHPENLNSHNNPNVNNNNQNNNNSSGNQNNPNINVQGEDMSDI